MSRPVILTCALTGGADTAHLNPAVPVTPEQIANEGIAAAKAGATIVHIHVRNPETGKASLELAHYKEVVERIRASKVDVLINLTTGPGARYTPSDTDPVGHGPGTTMKSPEFRVQHIEALQPDICSLDIATMNFGEYAFVNTPPHLRRMAELIAKTRAKPEIEVFDLGHVRLAAELVSKGLFKDPPLFQLCLGIPWGAPASTEAMISMKNLLPPNAMWAAFGISRFQFHMVAQAVILGGHARVGLEDNIYIERGKLAPGNAALVEKAVNIIKSLDEHPATPDEARKILGM
ncbi:MAG: 3-keto-5-aminohexanoate cleavage protein [Burkholderiales bacterium]